MIKTVGRLLHYSDDPCPDLDPVISMDYTKTPPVKVSTKVEVSGMSLAEAHFVANEIGGDVKDILENPDHESWTLYNEMRKYNRETDTLEHEPFVDVDLEYRPLTGSMIRLVSKKTSQPEAIVYGLALSYGITYDSMKLMHLADLKKLMDREAKEDETPLD